MGFHLVHRSRHCHGRPQRDELGAHATPDGTIRVAEHDAGEFALIRGQASDKAGSDGCGQLVEKLGAVVGIHIDEYRRHLGRTEPPQQFGLYDGVEQVEYLGGRIFREGAVQQRSLLLVEARHERLGLLRGAVGQHVRQCGDVVVTQRPIQLAFADHLKRGQDCSSRTKVPDLAEVYSAGHGTTLSAHPRMPHSAGKRVAACGRQCCTGHSRRRSTSSASALFPLLASHCANDSR